MLLGHNLHYPRETFRAVIEYDCFIESYQIANNCQGITIAFLQQFLISTLLERHDLALSVLKWHV